APTPCTQILHSGSRISLSELPGATWGEHTCTLTPSVRGYIEEKVLDFAKQNPGIVVYVTPQKCRSPTVVAEYLNGAVREEIIADRTVAEITQLVQKLANQSGLEIIRIRKPFHTDNPSIQGQWHPFTNKPSALPIRSLRRLEQQPNKV
uniref:Large ribosomal subunit protein mL43 n=1 Tax=Gopherus evgoodei TaxID=1825980 RepID=A0A8C4VV30_9SAUR